jgi:Tol biopolymer transport system component/DNA-binding winged helix-turn-helix (wHTH) protein
MSNASNRLYEFGDYCLDTKEKLLLCQGERIPLTMKAFETLLILVERHGHIVEKAEIIQRVWPDAAVEENNLNQNISAIRKALGENGHEQRFIETLPRRGYRFLGEVREVTGERTFQPDVSILSTTAPSITKEIVPFNERLIRQQSRFSQIAWLSTISLAVMAGVWYFARAKTSEPIEPAPAIKLNRLSATNDAWETAISPDGKLVAYVVGDAGHQSLRLKQIETATDNELLPPEQLRFRGLTFAPDGKSLYYGQQEKASSENILYQKPLQGGEGKRLLAGVDSAVTFSPDGKRIAFVRESHSQGKSSLVIANADGSNERVLITRNMPNYYAVEGPSWSPDGTLLAAAAVTGKPTFHFQIMAVRVDDGVETPIGQQPWEWAAKVVWINPQKLVLIGRKGAGDLHNNQPWMVEYPSGQAHKLLTTLSDYRSLSLSRDGHTLVTVRSETRSDLWILPEMDTNRARAITNDSASQAGSDGLAWTPDNRIIYTSLASGHKNLWIVQANGTQAKPLTTEEQDNAAHPSVTADGQQVVFNSGRAGFPRVWRIGVDGKSPTELTHGNLDLNPVCSLLEDFVYFSQRLADKRQIYRIRLDGREPAQALTDKLTDYPVVSPDGKYVACLYQETADSPQKVAVLPAQGGAPTHLLNIPVFPLSSLQWHPNGKALTYLTRSDRAMNLWQQPLTGGAPEQLTDFKSDRLFAYAWSRDGRSLAFSRGAINREVVTIGEFK